MSTDLKRIGYWNDNAAPRCDPASIFIDLLRVLGGDRGLPDPRDCVDPHWRDTPEGRVEFAAVLSHIRSGRTHEAFYGYSWCRICHRNDNGTKDLTDGVYIWPEGYAHYIEAHGVKPPQDFIEHVMSKASDYVVMYGAPW